MLAARMTMAAAGRLQTAALNVGDVFSADPYTGNGGTQSITNGVNLSGKGGLVWVKDRDFPTSHALFDTERGVLERLETDGTGAEASTANTLTAFNSNGFALGSSAVVNGNTTDYVAWTFRQAPKFFDVVTYVGNGTTQSIAHNLGADPGLVFIKNVGAADNWVAWHRSRTGEYGLLNLTSAFSSSGAANIFGNNTTAVDPTSTVFTVGNVSNVNSNGVAYVAYLFAHDEIADGIVQCGTYTGNGGTNSISLGWQPQ